jgi:RNA-binding protein NOB1
MSDNDHQSLINESVDPVQTSPQTESNGESTNQTNTKEEPPSQLTGEIISNTRKIKTLVVDTSAFIKNVQLQLFSDDIVTIPEVIGEVKDSMARAFLENFPFLIKQMSPTSDALKIVSDFAMKTGDYDKLSATDLKLLALTYMLTIKSDQSKVRIDPVQRTEGREGRPQNNNFFDPKKGIEMGFGEFNDSDGGWINNDNIEEINKSYNGVHIENEKEVDIEVACLTTDFAMQNVLLQMNMNLLSVDGISIKKVQKWIKHCYACQKICKDINAVFCPECGGNTLEKVSYTVDSEGNTFYNISHRKRNLRGTIYPVPMPKGGRNSGNLILRPDQIPKYKGSKITINLEDDEEFILNARKAPRPVPVIGYGKRNPNESRRKIGKKNRSKKRGF